MNSSYHEPYNYQENPDDFVDFRRYIGLFLSNWYWFIAALFVAGILAYGINTYSERVYTVTSSLLIKDEKGYEATGLDRIVPGGDIFKNQQNLQNEIGILKSFNLNARVMKELKEFHVTIVGIGEEILHKPDIINLPLSLLNMIH